MKKNSELTYKEMYRQPASFQAVNDTLEDIFKTLDKVFFSEKKYDCLFFFRPSHQLLFIWHRLQQQHFPLIQEFRQREFHALSCIISRKLM